MPEPEKQHPWIGSTMTWQGGPTFLETTDDEGTVIQEVALNAGYKALVTHVAPLPERDYLLHLQLLTGPDKGLVIPIRYPGASGSWSFDLVVYEA